MSWLNTTSHLSHTSTLPLGTTKPQALLMLSDRPFFLSCAPSLDSFAPLTPTTPPTVPDHIRAQARGEFNPECFTVTDIVHAMPAGLWDTNVVSTYEFTDITDGVFVRIRSPMGIEMDTIWEVKEKNGELELLETIEIRCSRLLMHLVKGECEGGWAKIHAKMRGRLEEELRAGYSS